MRIETGVATFSRGKFATAARFVSMMKVQESRKKKSQLKQLCGRLWHVSLVWWQWQMPLSVYLVRSCSSTAHACQPAPPSRCSGQRTSPVSEMQCLLCWPPWCLQLLAGPYSPCLHKKLRPWWRRRRPRKLAVCRTGVTLSSCRPSNKT